MAPAAVGYRFDSWRSGPRPPRSQPSRPRLRVREDELRERVLSALAARVADAESVAYVANRALEIVRARMAERDDSRDRNELARLDAEAARIVEAIAAAGDVAELTARLREVDASRERIHTRLRATPLGGSDDEIRERVRSKLDDVAGVLARGPQEARGALSALLAGRRLAVHADEDRGFRVEGVLRLGLETRNARDSEGPGRFRMVAGEGFEPPTSGL